jgi:sulfonate transport system permease protein
VTANATAETVGRVGDPPRPPAAATARPRSGTRWFRGLRPWLSTVAIVVVWQLVSGTGMVSPRVLPSPVALLGTAGEMIANGTLPEGLLVSLLRVLVGAAIGIGLGLALGLVSGFVRLGEDVIDRPVQMLRTIPFTAVAPLLLLWFGLNETPKIVLIAMATLVPTYLNTFSGVRNVDRKLVEVARAYRLSWARTALRVLLPGAVPAILVGLRQALGVAWIAVIIAETVNADSGIGFLLTNARTYVRTDIVMVCVAVYAILGLLTDAIVRGVEKPLLRWRPAGAGR